MRTRPGRRVASSASSSSDCRRELLRFLAQPDVFRRLRELLSNGNSSVARNAPGPHPHWDAQRRELRWGKRLVKQFRVPAPGQQTVLAAFEAQDWAPRLENPLPTSGDHDARDRLHHVIRSLNSSQINRLLRFRGDGTGDGILWEAVKPPRKATRTRRQRKA